MTKECFRCHAILPMSEFYSHPRMPDGHLGKCKVCAKQDARERYHEKMQDPSWAERERARNRERMGTAEARQRSRERARARRVGPNWTSPTAPSDVKEKARNALGNAVRDGKIVRPDHCGDCGKLSKRIHGHHLNYFQPFNVAWVCPACHRKRHAIYPERCATHLKQSA